MTPEQYDRVLNACRKLQAEGFKIVKDWWGVAYNPFLQRWEDDIGFDPGNFTDKCCCPLGALILTDGQGLADGHPERAAARVLGNAPPWCVAAFVAAIDGAAFEPGTMDVDWYVAGVRMRKELGL